MTQASPRFCFNCGTSVSVGERFCSNCGTAVAADTNAPTHFSATAPTSPTPSGVQNASEPDVPPPPPPETLLQTPQQVLQQPPFTPPPSLSSSYNASLTSQSTPPLPDYARVQKRSPLSRLISFLIFLLILALLFAGVLLLIAKF